MKNNQKQKRTAAGASSRLLHKISNLNLDIEAIENSQVEVLDRGITEPSNDVLLESSQSALAALSSLKHAGRNPFDAVISKGAADSRARNHLLGLQPHQLSKPQVLTGISKLGRDASQSDSAGEDVNITHNVTDEDERASDRGEGEVPESHRAPRETPSTQHQVGTLPSKGKVINMLNTQKYSSFGSKTFQFNRTGSQALGATPAKPPSSTEKSNPGPHSKELRRVSSLAAQKESLSQTRKVISLNLRTPTQNL